VPTQATTDRRTSAQTIVTRTEDRPSLGDIVSTAALAIGLITAWLYAAGYSYAYTYFDRFHIPFLMLDIPFEPMLVYGGLVVEKNIWASLICSSVIIAILWALARWASLLGRFLVTASIVVLVVVAFALAHSAGDSTGMKEFTQQRASDYRAFPRVELRWEGAGEPSDALLADILKTDCGRLLFASKERLFLVRPVRGAPSLPLGTFVISSNKIDAIRLQDEYSSCQ
jgi:hypothetical protein